MNNMGVGQGVGGAGIKTLKSKVVNFDTTEQ